MYEKAIAAACKLPAVAAIVGDRAYPLEFPQAAGGPGPTYPAIIWRTIAAPRRYTHRGNERFMPVRVQFDCYGDTLDDAAAVRDALVTELDLKQAVLDGVRVSRVFINMDRDGTDSESQHVGASRRIRRKILDVTMWCRSN